MKNGHFELSALPKESCHNIEAQSPRLQLDYITAHTIPRTVQISHMMLMMATMAMMAMILKNAMMAMMATGNYDDDVQQSIKGGETS